MHIRGYKKNGNIDTPLELAIKNELDRSNVAILATDHVKHPGVQGKLEDEQIEGKMFAYSTGMKPDRLSRVEVAFLVRNYSIV